MKYELFFDYFQRVTLIRESGGVATGKIFEVYRLNKGNFWAYLTVQKLATKGGVKLIVALSRDMTVVKQNR